MKPIDFGDPPDFYSSQAQVIFYLYSPISQIKHLSQGALQSLQHITNSILTPSIQMRKKLPPINPLMGGKNGKETSGGFTEGGILLPG